MLTADLKYDVRILTLLNLSELINRPSHMSSFVVASLNYFQILCKKKKKIIFIQQRSIYFISENDLVFYSKQYNKQ